MLHTGSEKTRRARNRGARLREGDDPDLWSALSVRGGGARATRAEREREVCGPCESGVDAELSAAWERGRGMGRCVGRGWSGGKEREWARRAGEGRIRPALGSWAGLEWGLGWVSRFGLWVSFLPISISSPFSISKSNKV